MRDKHLLRGIARFVIYKYKHPILLPSFIPNENINKQLKTLENIEEAKSYDDNVSKLLIFNVEPPIK